MIRELHIAKSFKTDIKKLNKKEKNDTMLAGEQT